MKKTIFILAVSMVVAFSNSAFAAGGAAILPHYFYCFKFPEVGSQLSFTHISNITSANIHVKVKYYEKVNSGGAPTILTDIDNDATLGRLRADTTPDNYSEITPGYSATFTIKPYETVRLDIRGTLSTDKGYGYGVIEWGQDSHETRGLVAHAYRQLQDSLSTYSQFSTPINGGLAF